MAPGTARPAAPAPIVARGGSDEATNFMEITGSSRATALRILRGSRLRGKSYEDAVTYYFEIGQDVFSTDDAADASGAGALGAGVVDSDFDMADSSDEEYGGGGAAAAAAGAAAAPAPAAAEDVAPMGYFASAATAVSGLMARIGGASYDEVAARRREAAAAAGRGSAAAAGGGAAAGTAGGGTAAGTAGGGTAAGTAGGGTAAGTAGTSSSSEDSSSSSLFMFMAGL